MKFGLILLSSLLLAGCGVESTWVALRENRAGVAALQKDDASLAADHFIRGLAEAPFESALHINLGLAFDKSKKPDEAVKSYVNGDRLADGGVNSFVARFNAGEVSGRGKKVDEALGFYQKALELKPDSLETKVNIELLTSGQGGGQGGEGKPQDGEGDSEQKQDSKGGQGQDKKEPKDPKDDKDKDQGEGDQENEKNQDKPKQYGKEPRHQPRPFQGELSESDVRKILGEIRQQEQRIRSEFNRRDAKERPRDKDW